MDEAHRIQFTLPVGYRWFHKDQVFNFQLNRWYSFGYARFEDMQSAGEHIESFEDWTSEMISQAELALAEGRLVNAAFYFRAAEFYSTDDLPMKMHLYDRFVELFDDAFKREGFERFRIPYDGGYLPAMRVGPVGTPKGTIMLHGGFDSFMEEFYSWMRHFADHGYEAIAFEGPGQGAALRRYGLTIDYRWELPTAAILDHFHLHDVTLLGVSMGGYLCFRAAALETRIRRVIASGVAFDYMQIPHTVVQPLVRLVFGRMRGLSNLVARARMQRDPMHRWSIGNLMYITGSGTPAEAIQFVMQLTSANLLSWLVEQDVLILTGDRDHFIPLKMHHMQVNALINARSVTARIFTAADQAENHCQVGNTGLALRVMTDWLDGLETPATLGAG